MEKKFVITINRSCGSGGSSVGRKIASMLDISFYDKELIEFESGDSDSALFQADERVKNSLYLRLYKDTFDGVLIKEDDPDYEAYQTLFEKQAQAIRKIAESENCVVVGRCSDFVLEQSPNRVSVFITAKGHDCVSREMDRLSITNKQAKDRREKINAYRSAYYRHHTHREWDNPDHYDLFLSTSEHSYSECAQIIVDYLHQILKKEDALE